ncbi:MAG: FKBP-type peptidyl-prolyl cis-trans isomerase, partial [Archaeoglobaceae archaeon]
MSAIEKGDFVKIGYTAKLDDGTVIDTTDEEVAKENDIFNERATYGDITVVVGERQVITGLDEQLEGKEVGFQGEIEVPSDKAFGAYDPENKDYVSLKQLGERPNIGQRVQVDQKYGYVERIIGRRVIVDFNHPFAGRDISFEVDINEKIEDLKEKIDAIFHIYTGQHVDIEIEDKKVRVEVPRGASLDQYFLMGKFSASNAIFKHLDVDELELVETFKKQDEMGVTTQEEPEVTEAEGSGATEEEAQESSEEATEEGTARTEEEEETLKTAEEEQT